MTDKVKRKRKATSAASARLDMVHAHSFNIRMSFLTTPKAITPPAGGSSSPLEGAVIHNPASATPTTATTMSGDMIGYSDMIMVRSRRGRNTFGAC